MHAILAAHKPIAFALNVANIKEFQSASSLQRSYTKAVRFAQETPELPSLDVTLNRMAQSFNRPSAGRDTSYGAVAADTGNACLCLRIRYYSIVAEHGPILYCMTDVAIPGDYSCAQSTKIVMCSVCKYYTTLCLETWLLSSEVLIAPVTCLLSRIQSF